MNVKQPIISITKVNQEKYYYCGQACIKMFDSNICFTQDELWELTQKKSKEPHIWYTDPISIQSVLKEFSDPNVEIELIEDACSESAVASLLANSFFSNNAVLIPSRGGSHWVIAHGAKLNESGAVTGIFITDPWKGIPGVVFYAFTAFFFNKYFSKVAYKGEWSAKRLCILSKKEKPKSHSFDVEIQAKRGGGILYSLDEDDIYDACTLNLKNLGFEYTKKKRAGGCISSSIVVKDVASNAMYRIIPFEDNDTMLWCVLNLYTLLVESICFSDAYVFYTSDEIQEILRSEFPQKEIKVLPGALFDSNSSVLYSQLDFVYKAYIDGQFCWVKAQDYSIIYHLGDNDKSKYN